MKNICLWTNDVETTSIWFNTLRYETGYKVLREGMPILLDLYERYNIKTTFFFTGNIAHKFPEIVKMILPFGHEVGSHGLSHEKVHSFDIMPLHKQIQHLSESKKILEDISGQEIISFRAPALRINSATAIALSESGYKIDSSVASQRFDMFMSFGSLKKLRWLVAPRLPYRTAPNNLFRKGNGNIIEVPLSAFLFPYVGTTMRVFPNISKFVRKVLVLENKLNGKPIVFDIHPNEFINEIDLTRKIERRSKNFIEFLISDGNYKIADSIIKKYRMMLSELDYEFYNNINWK